MAGSIGKLSAIVTADIGDFKAKMTEASKSMQDLQKSASSGAGGGGAMAMAGPLAAIVVGATKAKEMLMELKEATVGTWHQGMEDMLQLGKAADALGTSTETMGGIMTLAGKNFEPVTHGLEHLLRTMAEAKEGAGGAGGAFAR